MSYKNKSEEVKNQLACLKSNLIEDIDKLINTEEGNVKIIKFSSISKNWLPEFYFDSYQYKQIIKILERNDFNTGMKLLEDGLANGFLVNNKNRIVLNADVKSNLYNLLNKE